MVQNAEEITLIVMTKMHPPNRSSQIHAGIGDLETFLAVAETGSFRAASERLGISQPSVSNRIRKLESVLGLRLFDRTTRSVTLTDAGERLKVRAVVAVDGISNLFRLVQEEATLKRGQIRIVSAPSLAAVVLPPILREFHASYPGVNVLIHENGRQQSAELLAAGHFDFALLGDIIETPQVRFEPLFQEEWVTVAPRGHPILNITSPSLEDIAKYPLISLDKSAIWDIVCKNFDDAGIGYQVISRLHSLLTLIAVIEGGAGLSILPVHLLTRFDLNLVGTTKAPLSIATRTVGLGLRRGHALSPAAKVMRHLFYELIQYNQLCTSHSALGSFKLPRR